MNILISRLKKHVKSWLNWGKGASTEENNSIFGNWFILSSYINRSQWKEAASSRQKETTQFSRKVQNYRGFPRFGEWFVPLLHWRSCTEIMNGPHSPLVVSSGHQRQKILEERNLLCLAGSFSPFPLVRATKATLWILSLSLEKNQSALVLQYMLGNSRAPCRTAGLGFLVLSPDSPEATLATQRWRLVQAQASSKPEYFFFLRIYICVRWVWPGNTGSFYILQLL